MLWIPDPSIRQPLNWHTFTSKCLPPILLCYATALLVITPRTLYIRLPLLPITLYAVFRCATQVNLAKGYPDEERLVYLNHILIATMIILGARALIWTFQSVPYQRLQRYPSSATPNPLLDALDLFFNFRGIGWSWSSGLKVPVETRNTSSKAAFIRSTFRSFLISFFLSDFLLLAVQSFSLCPLSIPPNAKNIANTFASPSGTSIFAPTLPLHIRYLCSSLITFLFSTFIYSSFQNIYLLLSLLSLTLLSHTPAQWPPLFHEPWYSTSLTDFWTYRYHQLFRQILIATGGAPLFLFFGRAGAILGVFLASGLLHYLALWGTGRGTDFVRVVGYFLMMSVGMLAERAYKALTGRNVSGVGGWAWTMLWMVMWGHLLIEAWLIRGSSGSACLPHEFRPLVRMLRWTRGWMQTP